MAKYKVTQSAVTQLLEDVRREQIAIPELQRPFVWDSVKVRDLMDSLYKGYPVGYLITWQSVGAYLKDAQIAAHQQILIDGQQRIAALRAAVAGLKVVNKRYQSVRIKIAFNPVLELFATWTPVIGKNPEWIPDISELFNATSTYGFVKAYFEANPEVDPQVVETNIGRLEAVKNAQIGIISLNDDLDVETVAEIFIRINSKGVPLSSADFAMSKIATFGERGRNIRKLIDYFCQLAVAPHAYSDIQDNDTDFAATTYLSSISWLKDDTGDLYDPTYGDIIRVAGLVGFSRGKASSIVGEISGRDPETRKIDESRIPVAYDKLESALLQIVKKYHFENFIMIIKSAGFIAPGMIGSKNALNFAYALYLRLRADATLSEGERKRIVRRWFVMSMLTARHSGSFESTWEQDIRRINTQGAAAYLKQIEESELTDGFWEVSLPNSLETTSTASPFFQTFLAAQVAGGARGFLSKSITVAAMHQQSGDIHHVVPKDFLQKNGFADRSDYNQVANFALTETSINISISNKPPSVYMADIAAQIESGALVLGEITDSGELERNLAENAIPPNLANVSAGMYPEFLVERRKLMAGVVRTYFEGL
ncbi:GmrSD restriction endonuclease domain-containing protein [Arthrobacter sp. AOP36-A1-22]|uniref:GmrSD restriction endonuclease domain-containing protein n=1 Tax=unclassified Arthrobacter TaxID=235627 RepID=UPI004033654C